MTMSNRGITIIEIMIALVLFGAMAAVATPRFLTTREALAARHAADEFAAVHRLARATAVREGRVVRLRIDAAAGRFWMEMDTSLTRSGAMDTLGPVRSVSSKNVSMSSSRAMLCFDGRGIATPIWSCPPGDAVVTFTRGQSTDTLTTTITGKLLR